MEEIIQQLKLIEGLEIDVHATFVETLNQKAQSFKLYFEKIVAHQLVFSDDGKPCMKISLGEESVVFICADNYLLSTHNGRMMRVSDMPELVSLTEVKNSIDAYLKNPEPDNNLDRTLALYLMNRLLLLSAEEKGFDLGISIALINSAVETTSIADEYETYIDYL